MIPYFEFVSFRIGPLTLYVWGILVAVGAFVGLLFAERLAPRYGLKGGEVGRIAFWALFVGFVGARLAHAAFYDPTPFLADPLEIFRIWHGGMSSLGGIVAGAVTAVFLARHDSVSVPALADTLSGAFPLAWSVGRLGCFLVHDHPGRLSGSFLAVRYPGGARFDLGLVESLTGLAVFGAWLLVTRRTKRPGASTAAVWFTYMALRFWSDSLRATDLPGSDVRAFGLLTPVQLAIPFLSAGLAVWLIALRKSREKA